jgi:hypothetical protein
MTPLQWTVTLRHGWRSDEAIHLLSGHTEPWIASLALAMTGKTVHCLVIARSERDEAIHAAKKKCGLLRSRSQ